MATGAGKTFTAITSVYRLRTLVRARYAAGSCSRAGDPAILTLGCAGFLASVGKLIAPSNMIATTDRAPLNDPVASLTCAANNGPTSPAMPRAVRSAP